MQEKIPSALFFTIIYGVIQNFIIIISILSQLWEKKDMKKALSFLFCLIAANFFILSPLLVSYKTIIPAIISIPCIASIGPLYYISMKTVIRGENILLRTDCLHFIPAVLFVLCIAAMLLTANDLLKMHIVLMLLLSTFYNAGYFVATVIFLAKQIPGKINGDNIDNKIILRMALNILFAICFLVAGIGQMNNQHIYHLGIVSNIVLVLASYIVSLRYPLKIDYYRNAKNRLFFAYLLPGTDPETLKRDITSKLLSNDLYKDEVTLSSLAMAMDIKPHQLSHFINNYLDMSFSDLINSHRVEEVKKEILSKPEATVLAIAYDCGFNSKASFNRAFKKFTGLTPSEFRNHHK